MRVLQLPSTGLYRVLAVCDERGNCLLQEFLESLGANLRRNGDAMLELLERVAISGPPRNTEVSHQVHEHIWEFIKRDLRVFYFYDQNKVVVCTHGIIKKRQKTPKTDIEFALKTRERYFVAKAANKLMVVIEG